MNFFKRRKESVKRQRLDLTGEFQQHSRSIVEASYVVSFMIAKQLERLALNHVLQKWLELYYVKKAK